MCLISEPKKDQSVGEDMEKVIKGEVRIAKTLLKLYTKLVISVKIQML